MYLAKMDDDELDYPTDRFHELNKDAMLEKVVLLWACYFCVATELRFLSESRELELDTVSKDHSDMWHAQAAFMGAVFLPYECPLVDHLITSYEKYHLKTRANDSEGEDLDSTNQPKKTKLMFKKRKCSRVDSRNAEILK